MLGNNASFPALMLFYGYTHCPSTTIKLLASIRSRNYPKCKLNAKQIAIRKSEGNLIPFTAHLIILIAQLFKLCFHNYHYRILIERDMFVNHQRNSLN